ncbi:MAG: hypothetical protein C0184_05700, partial [Chloroflexus aggregans]
MYLVKAGGQDAGEAGKHLAGAVGEKIKALWARIWLKMDGRPATQETVQEMANKLMTLTHRPHSACNYASSSPMWL